MFEIGSSLREARTRRGIDFAQAELATKIRGKYLRALEEEEFDVLPAQTYVKGFLRTYAEYLGLDGQLYVDEYNSRFVAGEDHHEPRVRRAGQQARRQRTRRLETSAVVLVLAAVVLIAVIVIAGWKMASTPSPTSTHGKQPTARSARAVPPLLLLVPSRGASYVVAHNGTPAGRLRYDGTLQKGDQPLAIRGHRLWLQISNPSNVRILVRGRLVHVPGGKPQTIVVTPTGWRPA
ncbi:MAG TPA: helix-turn-helix domain-containing protein [Gaiellaceae bacterium]|nr:helix-turn-helix domain-containing protein [Gaiellaceae bacterium]